MKRGGGNRKGGAFERKTAKKLSLWISGGKDKDLLWRTPGSGARSTRQVVCGCGWGDIGIQKQKGKFAKRARRFVNNFCCELKHYKHIDFIAPLFSDTDKITKWWNKLTAESRKHNVMPMLIVQQNRMASPIMFFDSYIGALILSKYPDLRFITLRIQLDDIKQRYQYRSVIGFRQDEILKIDYKEFRSRWK